ncbi:hypothetical protein CAEBREN_03391 [Caenorhabditis brenneri]|uniref:Uncharacterized protein n=1 Tax=Caenorhabditis brenneri TaxID=135651 RepID=G0NXF8_CAEBE|nr:hypothetical protein CAEBREN_03391 [Caenorhabditis brenneri]
MSIRVLGKPKVKVLIKIEYYEEKHHSKKDIESFVVVTKKRIGAIKIDDDDHGNDSRKDELDDIKENDPIDIVDDSLDPHRVIDGTMSIVTGTLAIGMAVAPGVGWAVAMAAGAVIGMVAKKYIKKKDDISVKFKLMIEKFVELDRKVSNRFDKMEKFIVENNFTMEIIIQVRVLKLCMMKVLEASGTELDVKEDDEKAQKTSRLETQKAIGNFKEVYDRNRPLNLGYTLWSLLDQEGTNPLMTTLKPPTKKEPPENESKEDKAKRERKTEEERNKFYEQWKKTIRALISELMVIELIAAGMFRKQDPHDLERLNTLQDRIEQFMDKFEEKHEIGAWHDFRKYFHSHVTPLIKGHHRLLLPYSLRTPLMEKFPEDSFYICVHDNYQKFGDDFYYHCANKWQLAEFDGKKHSSRVSVFVYRTRRANKMDHSEFEKVSRSVLWFVKHKPDFGPTMKSAINECILKQKTTEGKFKRDLVRRDGLVVAINCTLRPYTTVVSFPRYRAGPGRAELVDTSNGEDYRFMLLVALP